MTEIAENKKSDLKFAVLIDADNISYRKIKDVLDEIAKYGTPTIKRVYGVFSAVKFNQWKPVLAKHAILPVMQYAYTKGKNATDATLIIDAMDILHYQEYIDGLCIVSSDSDYTRLAGRFQEADKVVFGFGEKKTPEAFVNACTRFFHIEEMGEQATPESVRAELEFVPRTRERKRTFASGNPNDMNVRPVDDSLRETLVRIIGSVAREDGWSFLGTVGKALSKEMPGFDSQNYGFEKLAHLVKSMPDTFELVSRPTKNPRTPATYVRTKQND